MGVIAPPETKDCETQGWALVRTGLKAKLKRTLCEEAFAAGAAGTRCLLDHTAVRDAAKLLRMELIASGYLPPNAVVIQAIAFNKTVATNWKVPWHQDVVFPLARAAKADGYELPSTKGGVNHARPPREVLEELLAVRLHLDDCDETNGPLRLSPGSHRQGILKSASVPEVLMKFGETVCLAQEGEALLMKPLLLHASSPASAPRHRRVLHLVYHSGQPTAEPWHRCI